MTERAVSNTALGQRFGTVVAISGDTMVVTAPFEDGGSVTELRLEPENVLTTR